MELLDLVDFDGRLLGRTVERGTPLGDDEYIQLVIVYLKCRDKFLLQKTSIQKGDEYAATGGHVSSGNTSKEQAVIECNEELGITLDSKKLELLGKLYSRHRIFNVYLYEDNSLDQSKMVLQNDEVDSVYWFTPVEIDELIAKGMVRLSTCKHYQKFIREKRWK
jgi:8-oxo-dGTP pyrophosphatase MutT (NUDIX family)